MTTRIAKIEILTIEEAKKTRSPVSILYSESGPRP